MPDPTLGTVKALDVMSLTTRSDLFGQTILNTFHWIVPTAPPTTQRWEEYDNLFQYLTAAPGDFAADFRACMTNNLGITNYRFQYLTEFRQIFRDFPVVQLGTHAGACLTPNMAASIERRANLATRQGVGRVQIAGVPSAQVTSGLLSGAYLTVLNDFAETMMTEITTTSGVTWVPCLTGFKKGSTTRVTTELVSAQAKLEARVMRRRTVGLGI